MHEAECGTLPCAFNMLQVVGSLSCLTSSEHNSRAVHSDLYKFECCTPSIRTGSFVECFLNTPLPVCLLLRRLLTYNIQPPVAPAEAVEIAGYSPVAPGVPARPITPAHRTLERRMSSLATPSPPRQLRVSVRFQLVLHTFNPRVT